MPIQVNLNELEAPPPAPAPAPQQVPSWAQPSNRTERRCVATNDVTVRAAAALDSEVVGELRAGDHCTVDGTSSISRQGRVVERSRICAPLNGWVSTSRLAPADDVLELDARPPPRSAFYAGQRVSVDDQGGRLACRRGAGWRVDLEDGGTVFVDDDSKLEPAPTPRSHWLDGVLEAIAAPAEVFLLGESTHGTRDYYALRFELVQSLIELKGVSVVAIEGDCVAAARVDSYVRGTSSDRTAEEALRGFTGGRGTTPWLWRNKEVVHFVEWLRERNASSAAACGFAGLDLFSARESARMVVNCVDHGPRNPTHLIAFHTGGRISRIGGPATKPRCGE